MLRVIKSLVIVISIKKFENVKEKTKRSFVSDEKSLQKDNCRATKQVVVSLY